ncbi:MAG: DNA primase [SAR202 cluster bacterium]|nr:DNA primase [SAR202 cluster bacterium]
MSAVDEIKARLDIVDVIGGYVQLQKAGRNFKARCPFHNEKTPSFIVNPERQSWHCFGQCGVGGDVLGFVMRQEKLDFGETVKFLAQKTGVVLQDKRTTSRNDFLYRVNQEAARFYQQVLASPEGQEARDYIAKRGVNAQIAEAFQLGMSPRGRDKLKSHLFSLGFNLDYAIEAGLLRRSDDGNVRDFFWGRLMFPIHDREGRPIGFGGRTLDGSEPKYLNTAATPVFDKRATLYGLHKAAAGIKQAGVAVIVEGYMDAMTAHQYGFSNVVASMGTALTEYQVALLKGMAKRFVQALDPDTAGQEATRRSLDEVYRISEHRQLGQKAQFELRIAVLPPGIDPDEVIKRDTKEWERAVAEAVEYMDFYIGAMARRHDLATPEGKALAAEALAPLIAAAEDPIAQEKYFNLAAKTIGVSAAALQAYMGRARQDARRRPGTESRRPRAGTTSLTPFINDRRDPLEEFILALVLSRPDLREKARETSPEFFRMSENREVFTCWQRCNRIEEVAGSLDITLHDHLARLGRIDITPDGGSAELALTQSLKRLELRYLQEHQEDLLASEDMTAPPPREIEEAITRLNARMKELFSQRN